MANNKKSQARPAASTRNQARLARNAAGGGHPTSKSAARRKPPARQEPTGGFARLNQEHPLLVRLLPVALVVVIIVVMVVIKTTGGGGNGHGNGSQALPAGVLANVTSVPASTLSSVGVPNGVTGPQAIKGKTALLTGSDGKPELLYVGSEYCPFCAAERWALVESLSHFGTFSGLRATQSGSLDEFPGTKTFSFYKSTYTSQYLDFKPVELKSNVVSGGTYTTLETEPAAVTAIQTKYDTAPYTTQAGSIPFLDFGNRYLMIGASYTPQVLQGLSMQQIAADMHKASTQVALGVDGTANTLTAAICAITQNQPASVCSTPTVSAIEKRLGA